MPLCCMCYGEPRRADVKVTHKEAGFSIYLCSAHADKHQFTRSDAYLLAGRRPD